jgi:hypothetical protein
VLEDELDPTEVLLLRLITKLELLLVGFLSQVLLLFSVVAKPVFGTIL